MEVVVCFGSIAFFMLLFCFLLGWRYLNYIEVKAMAEKGLVKPEKVNNSGGKSYTLLFWGVIIGGIGLAITFGLLPMGATGTGGMYPLGLGPWMLLGYLPLFFGLSLILLHVLTQKDKPSKTENEHPAAVSEQQDEEPPTPQN